jgi:hypothetical protein
MKKNHTVLAIIFSIAFTASAQSTIFLETFGTTKVSRDGCTSVAVPGTAEAGKYDPQKNELFTDHDWSIDSHVWNNGVVYSQNSAIITQNTCDSTRTSLNIRTNNPSNIVGNTYTGASGNGNLYFNANVNNSFTISGINTLNYSGISLSFGIYGKNKSDVKFLKLQYDNGTGLTDAGSAQIAALSTTKATWLLASGITLPASSNLSLTFSSPNLNGAAPIEIRIDDIKISGTPASTAVNPLKTDNRKVYVSNSVITLDGFASGSIEIYNMQGKKVFTSQVQESIQPDLAKGLYIVRIGDFRQKISL